MLSASDHPAMGEASEPRKRRPWLLAPAVALAVFLAACATGWLYARVRIEGALDARAAALRRAGWTLDVDGRRFEGFPFRLKLVLPAARLVAPSGWGLEAPGLEAEALIFDPGHWVFAAPRGLVLRRGSAGALAVAGRSIGLSVAGLGGRPPRVAAVGEGLTFTPAAGAGRSAFRSADRLEAYLKPAPGGDGEVLVQITGGRAAPKSLPFRLAGAAPVTGVIEGRLVRLSAFEGPDWAARVRAWARAGGGLHVNRVEARGGAARLSAEGGDLSVGPDGRLRGAVPLALSQTPGEVGAPEGAAPTVGEARDGATRAAVPGGAALVFENGEARLGGVRVGPAPKVG